MKELETRIVDIDVEDIRSKLLALGGVKVKSEDQVMRFMIFLMEDYCKLKDMQE